MFKVSKGKHQRTAHTKMEEGIKGKWLSCPGCGCFEELTQTGMLLGFYRAAVDYKGIPDFGKVPSACSQPQCSAKLHRSWEQHTGKSECLSPTQKQWTGDGSSAKQGVLSFHLLIVDHQQKTATRLDKC